MHFSFLGSGVSPGIQPAVFLLNKLSVLCNICPAHTDYSTCKDISSVTFNNHVPSQIAARSVYSSLFIPLCQNPENPIIIYLYPFHSKIEGHSLLFPTCGIQAYLFRLLSKVRQYRAHTIPPFSRNVVISREIEKSCQFDENPNSLL